MRAEGCGAYITHMSGERGFRMKQGMHKPGGPEGAERRAASLLTRAGELLDEPNPAENRDERFRSEMKNAAREIAHLKSLEAQKSASGKLEAWFEQVWERAEARFHIARHNGPK